ncbi:MAG: hypothetical protein ACT4SY_13950 [Hyphomicrobiales bacterium]
MRQIFKMFFGKEEARPFGLLLCPLLAGVAEAASIGSLLPAATAASGGDSGASSPLNGFVRSTIGGSASGERRRYLF